MTYHQGLYNRKQQYINLTTLTINYYTVIIQWLSIYPSACPSEKKNPINYWILYMWHYDVIILCKIACYPATKLEKNILHMTCWMNTSQHNGHSIGDTRHPLTDSIPVVTMATVVSYLQLIARSSLPTIRWIKQTIQTLSNNLCIFIGSEQLFLGEEEIRKQTMKLAKCELLFFFSPREGTSV